LARQKASLAQGGELAKRRHSAVIARTMAEAWRDAQQMKSIESALAAANAALTHTDIVARLSGIVVAANARIGEAVFANDLAAPLFQIAEDSQQTTIAFDVSRSDLKNLRIDTAVSLTSDAAPNRPFSGVIARIARRDAAVTEHGDVLVFAQKREGELPAGERVTGVVETALRDNVLRAPLASLHFRPRLDAATSRSDDTEARLWVLRNGALTCIDVALVTNDGRYVEIIGGSLKEGDQIVVGDKNADRPQ